MLRFTAVKEVPVTYKDGETTMKGFVVYDDGRRASALAAAPLASRYQ